MRLDRQSSFDVHFIAEWRPTSKFKASPPRHEFRNLWLQLMGDYAHHHGIERSVVSRGALYQIGADLDARLLINRGLARPADYRDELESLITIGFPTRRSFCEATGLSEDMLSHVLAKRKNLAIDTLAEALGKIGYAIHILPQPEVEIR
jgi:hypothetical protein